MITLTARIQLGGEGGSISNASIVAEQTNYSADIQEVVGKHTQDKVIPFILYTSKLGSGAVYVDKLNYWVSSQLTDANNTFAQPITLKIIGKDIELAIIEFDTINNGFPPYVVVDNTDIIYTQDPRVEILFKNKANTHTIEFSTWNKPNSPAIISSIYADLSVDINRSNLLSYSGGIGDRTDIKFPKYGLLSNSGRISFNDENRETYELIVQQIIKASNKIDVYINNTDTDFQEKVATFVTAEWDYDNDNREVNVQLKDLLEYWQEITVKGINYVPTISEAKTLKEIYEYLYSISPTTIYKLLSFEELDSETQEILETTTIQYPILDDDTLWNEWAKLCEVSMAHMYIDKDGNIVFKYSGAK